MAEEPSEPAGEEKKAQTPAAAAAGPEQRRSGPGRSTTVLAGTALVLALVALAGAGASGWAWYQLRGEQARLAELEGRVSALDGRLASLRGSAATKDSVDTLKTRLDTLEQTEKQRDAALRDSLHALATRLAGAGNAYREDEAESLMRLARQRLELASDARGATQALTLADEALAATDDASLDPVRKDLAAEIQALKAVPQPDIAGAYARLDAVAARIDALPLAGDRIEPSPAAARNKASPGWSWQGLGAAFKRAFSPLIVVRKGPKARPLLPPREAYFVRENVKLALHSAQSALLARDAGAYRASLRRARGWLSSWFATGAAPVESVDDTLGKLAALQLSPQLPQLGAALKRLQALRAGDGGR